MVKPSRAGVREILHLALPIILSMASATVASFIDTWFVALVGTAEVAAAMPAGITAYTLTALPLGITQCVSTFASQALGRRRLGEGAVFAWQGLYLSIVVGIAAFVLWPVAPLFFSSFGHDPEVVALEVLYFRIRLWGVGVGVAIGALNGFFYGIHRPRLPLVAMIGGNIVNVILCYVLVFGKMGMPALGLAGAAIAFVLSFIFQFAILAWAFLSAEFRQEFATLTTWAFAWDHLRQLVRIGWPAGMHSTIDVLGWGVLIVLLVGRFGKEQLAASNIAIQYMTISFMPGIGLAQALTAIVGRYIGEGKREIAIQRVYEGLLIALGYMAFMGVVYVVCRRPFIAFFNTDPLVIQVGSNILLCVAMFQIFDAMNFTFSGALRGAGDTLWPAVLIAGLSVSIFAPLSLGAVAYTNWEALGPWIAGTLYSVILGLVLWWRFARGKWQEIDIFARRTTNEKKGAVQEPPLLSSSEL